MKTRCPRCATRYDVDAEALLDSGGRARCARCGSVFDAVAERRDDADGDDRPVLQLSLPDGEADAAADEDRELPFDVPDDLPPIEPDPSAALDVADTLEEKTSWRGLWYTLFALPLLVALGAQIAWQYREPLLQRFPQLEIVCEHLPCRPVVVDRPDAYEVVRREMTPTAGRPGWLTLSATIRNGAEYPQPLPDIQLSLLDNNAAVLARRRLAPREYLQPAPPADRVVAYGEVLTIAIDFEDPGHIASGFMIDFF